MRRAPRRPILSRAGFTLVEIMVVVLIISVLATLAVPAFARVKRKAKTAVLVGDFRTFSAAFDSYAQEMGNWPAETAAGVMPAGMAGRLNDTSWLRTTPMGGKYNWENNQTHFGVKFRAAIAISATAAAPLTLDVTQLTDLEQAMDGGATNWLGGTFQIGTGIIPLVIVQP